jgi:hypothetical protein
MGIASKGLDFYTYVSSPGFKVSFAARGNANAEFFESDSKTIARPSGRWIVHSRMIPRS